MLQETAVVDGERLVGIVTNRDVRFEGRMDEPVSSIMTPQDRLVTAKEGASREEVLGIVYRVIATHSVKRGS